MTLSSRALPLILLLISQSWWYLKVKRRENKPRARSEHGASAEGDWEDGPFSGTGSDQERCSVSESYPTVLKQIRLISNCSINLFNTRKGGYETGVPNPCQELGHIAGVSKASSVFTATPIAHSATWAPPRVGTAAAIDSHRSLDPAVNCTWRAPRCVLLMRI